MPPTSSDNLASSERQLFNVRTQWLSLETIDNRIDFYGDTEPYIINSLIPEISGKVRKIFVKEGHAVEKGQVIAELDMRNSNEDLASAVSKVDEAKKRLDANEKLYKRGYISEMVLFEQRTAYQDALSRLESSKSSKEDYLIRAPMSGVLNKFDLEVGEIVSSQASVGEISDLSKIKTKVYVPEKYIPFVKEGDVSPIKFKNGNVLEGKVIHASRVAEDKTHTYAVTLLSDQVENSFSGMSTTVNLSLNQLTGYRVSPFILGVDVKDNLTVKLSIDGTVKELPVKVLKTFKNNDVFIFSSELPEKAQVIVLGAPYVSNGDKVNSTLMGGGEA